MKAVTIFGVLAIVLAVGGTATVIQMMGAGGFKRMVTVSGVYAVCKPQGYDVVCFLDADSKDGGMACVPLSLAGGECRK